MWSACRCRASTNAAVVRPAIRKPISTDRTHHRHPHHRQAHRKIHSENEAGTGPNFKDGFGFSSMLCLADATGEALAGIQRPVNAGANCVADHFTVLDAVSQLRPEIAVDHHAGDDASTVRRREQVRTDSAACSTRFATGCRSRNIGPRVAGPAMRLTRNEMRSRITDVRGTARIR